MEFIAFFLGIVTMMGLVHFVLFVEREYKSPIKGVQECELKELFLAIEDLLIEQKIGSKYSNKVKSAEPTHAEPTHAGQIVTLFDVDGNPMEQAVYRGQPEMVRK